MIAFGECLPYEDNRVYQDPDETDQWVFQFRNYRGRILGL